MLMMQEYNLDDIINQTEHFMNNCECFPLLCKLSKNKTHDEVKKLFTAPVSSIQKDISSIIDENKYQFCALVLCILFEGGFNTDWLKLKSPPEEKKNRLEDIIQEFDINLSKEMHRNSLKSEFSTLNGTYLKLRGTECRIINDKMYAMAAVICEQHLTDCFIKYASSVFIRDHFVFESITEVDINTDLFVLVTDQEEDYFERLLCDLKDDVITSTFNNKQLIYQTFREKLLSFYGRNEDAKRALKELETTGRRINNKLNLNTLKYFSYPLVESASSGYYDLVHFLIVHVKCNVDKTDTAGRSPIYMACERGHLDVAKLLLRNNANVLQCDQNRISPFYVAMEMGNTNLAKLLLQNNAEVYKVKWKKGISPLYIACERKYTDIVDSLVQTNADIFECARNGKCPLYVAWEGGHTDIVQMLLQNNVDVSSFNWMEGQYPLYAATKGNFTDILDLLLYQNTDTSHCYNHEKPPLYMTLKGRHKDIIKLAEHDKLDDEPLEDNIDSYFCIPTSFAVLDRRPLTLNNSSETTGPYLGKRHYNHQSRDDLDDMTESFAT
ncbi:putative ankyrin repeat protein RF_0381 [Mytilus edulis]|uniref:putative ankyrin repeat protein RF_0381 n=1 Tax=Mytilus edulis TaxID=6550 RepID=UPI0039F0FFAD